MATRYPVYLSATSGNTYPAASLNAKESTQRERRTAEYYIKFDGTEAAADVYMLGLGGGNAKFPKGTTVDAGNGEFFVETDPGVTLTGDVGDLDSAAASAAYPNGDAYAVAHIANDADRYCDGVNLASVGRVAFATGVGIAVPHTLQEDCFLTFTLATVSTPSASGKIRVRIPYFLP